MAVHVEILGRARLGWACQARARRGSTHCGEESPQKSGLPRPGAVRRGVARHGEVRRGLANTLFLKRGQKFGRLGQCMARRCLALQTHCPSSRDRSLRRGLARQGLARQGEVWRGLANTQHPHGVLKFAENTNNERKQQWKTS